MLTDPKFLYEQLREADLTTAAFKRRIVDHLVSKGLVAEQRGLNVLVRGATVQAVKDAMPHTGDVIVTFTAEAGNVWLTGWKRGGLNPAMYE
jgi:hypothetical protein